MKPATSYVLGALGDLAGSALFRNTLRYWWVTAPLGYMVWASIQDHRKRKDLNALRVVNDVAPAVSLVAILVLLNETLDQRAARESAALAASMGAQSIKDASFTQTAAVPS